MLRVVSCLACVLACATPLWAQVRPADGVERLVAGLERSLDAGDAAAFAALFSPDAGLDIDRYRSELFTAGAVRTVVRERDRAPLEGVPEGEGHQMVVEVFAERPGTARILTTGLEVRRPPDGDADSWRIVRVESVASVQGLYRLRLNTSRAFDVRGFEFSAEDLLLTLQEGTVFLVDCDDGVTGVLLLGRGQMRFSPRPEAEQGQVRIFRAARRSWRSSTARSCASVHWNISAASRPPSRGWPAWCRTHGWCAAPSRCSTEKPRSR